MCGIFTAVNPEGKSFKVLDFLNCVTHRGPDSFGWINWESGDPTISINDDVIHGELVQGHTRLSIIDLSEAGSQPMLSLCKRYSLTYNGEVYNYLELRAELFDLGVCFQSDSDTEVILKALIQWGEGCIHRFRGMFTFTFYDSLNDTLMVARDHFGIKPLFYTQVGDNLYFASEIVQLLQLEGVSRLDYDSRTIYEYLCAGAADHSERTMYKDIKQFPAAHYANFLVNNGSFVPVRYWDLDLSSKIRPTFKVASQKVRALFLESVALHMRSDVPVGAALSGGIDSSAIVCAIRHLYPKQEIHTFSYIASAEELSEEKWIDVVNDYIGAIDHKIVVSKEELIHDLDDLVNTQGEPFGSTSIYAQYRVFKEAKNQNIKVMLDGQGADEMLAGYIFFQASALAGYLTRGRFFKAFKFFKSCIANTSSTSKYLMLITISELLPVKHVSKIKSLFMRRKRIEWISDKWMRDENINDELAYRRKFSWRSPLRSHLKSTLTELGLPNLLRYEDRNSMRWSVESRVPFLYVDLVEYLYSLPEEYLLNGDGVSKHIFREAMRGIVPNEILDRMDKVGFATPEGDWLIEMDNWVSRELSKAKNMAIFSEEALSQEWLGVTQGTSKFDWRCWRWLNLINWFDNNERH
jgi:asparagine synthase (glutamine-hydrolysing)